MAKKKRAGQSPRRGAKAGAEKLHVASARPVDVKHFDVAHKFVKPKRIHPRRLLPLITEGAEREFHSQSLPMMSFQQPAAASADPRDGELALAVNTELTSPALQQTASNVDEPSTAANGQVVLYTGNWYAAVSTDAGQTFKYLDPANAFKDHDPPGSSFCCDQIAQYIAKIDTFVWLLQYGPQSGDNIQRLAFATTAQVQQQKWRLFDITTQFLGTPGAFLDFPDVALGENALYVTTNIFWPGDKAGSAVVRIPFDGIAAGQVAAKPFVSDKLQSFRVAQNCGTTAFFAAHQDTSTLAVFSWPEDAAAPTPKAVGVARWLGGNGYISRTPDGRRWLDRADPRITGAAMTGNELWFAWGVDTNSNHRPRPFVQIARIDAANLTLLENINVFDPDSATCYAGLSSNARGEVGISYMIGGGTRYPSHAVGILTGTRRDLIVAKGERSPQADTDTNKFEWGDYLTVRRMYASQNLFAATGYTMKGQGDGSNRDATPRFVVFGRAVDVPVAASPPDDVAPVVPAPPQDVNQLPMADAATAAQIKAAAGMVCNTALPVAPPADFAPELETKPGSERWPVKTGADPDARNVAARVVQTTVEEMINIPRPAALGPVTSNPPAFQSRRVAPVETTIWQLDCDITLLKQEKDGDYHLVLRGASGETMIGEVPTPRPPFVKATSPWLANIKTARKAVDDKLVSKLSPADFVPLNGMLVPRESLTESSPQAAAAPGPAIESFVTPESGVGPAFKTKIKPTAARITGVGFFDKVHGQAGVSQSNGIELHPILKIEWL
jgi:hypothetical protein